MADVGQLPNDDGHGVTVSAHDGRFLPSRPMRGVPPTPVRDGALRDVGVPRAPGQWSMLYPGLVTRRKPEAPPAVSDNRHPSLPPPTARPT